MSTLNEGDLLWTPTPDIIEQANLTDYRRWLKAQGVADLANYGELWRWSLAEAPTFWASLFDYFDLVYSQKWRYVIGDETMPGVTWFAGCRLNYAENIFAKMNTANDVTDTSRPMLLYKSEDSHLTELSWHAAYEQVNRLATKLRQLGVQQGDRVVAYVPNIPEAVIAVLAVASIGAIWSSCSPDFGRRSVLDRFTQIEPTVLIAVDGYNYGGKTFDRREVIGQLQTALPTLEHTILIPHVAANTGSFTNTLLWDDALASVEPPAQIEFAQLPFDHPLWVLYSSGTTGLPKPIVHGHGGILLENVKGTVLHNDLKVDDRFFWYSSTGWMMWNYLVGSLLSGATAILYNGSPAYPDINVLFELAEESRMTYFGTSAAFVSACIKSGIRPNQTYNLNTIRAVGSTGSPLSTDGFQWIYDNINSTLALESLSGGTDLCAAFIGGIRTQPIYAGELQGAFLGAAVHAFNQHGEPVIDEVGELVLTQPSPSMPLFLWGDDANMSRYKASYFEMYPAFWRHGDWIKINQRGGGIIYGRSDSTINRQGIRMGTSEFYRVVESFDEIVDSLVIDLEFHGRTSFMSLFIVMQAGATLDTDLKRRINAALRSEISPRHTPNEIVAIDAVPYTLSGKKMEVPIRKILLGLGVTKTANPGAMRNPESIQFFADYAQQLNKERQSD